MTEPIDLHGANLLLVDDIPANLDVLCGLLEPEGYQLALAGDGPLALKIAGRLVPDLILLDVVMPGMEGYEVCRRLKQDPQLRDIPVIFITGRDQPEDVLAGFEAGGVDYITKPFRDAEVLARVQTHLQLRRQQRALAEKNDALEEEIARRQRLSNQLSGLAEDQVRRWGLDGFIGQSAAMQAIFDTIELAQEHAMFSVLISGESGTGKELVAQAVHAGSPRRGGPFVPINCAAIAPELAEAELFGHDKGAFTGADQDRVGCFEMAHQGTLFLDELGELPLAQQAKLLRVLEDGKVRRVGGQQERQVDVRVVAATNADLEQRVQEGGFRQDLYFRLARLKIAVPPLRQRPDDIAPLVQHFLERAAADMGRDRPELSAAALAQLQAYAFPGNVRELKHTVELAVALSRGGPIEPQHLQEGMVQPQPTEEAGALVSLEENERRHIQAVLGATNGRLRGGQGAAAILGVPESTLRGKLKKLGLERI
ncbi:MAG: response regulator [Candidatus Latescibacteria bacterium]|nr:response regulator [Candidatus Latescibacterota bacterium]